MAAADTPPPTPTTRTVSPFFSRAFSNIRSAVTPARPNDPATSHERASGLRTALIVGTTSFSVKVPGWCSPRTPKESQ